MPKEKHLSEEARESLAEDKFFGTSPRRRIVLGWNNMIIFLDRRDYASFIKESKIVQSLVRVMLKSESHTIRRLLMTARYCVAKGEKEVHTAYRALDKARRLLNREAINITNLTVIS